MDEDIRRKIEPNGVESVKRFKMLKEFRKTNASIGLHVMPIIPFLTDNEENMEAICCNGHEADVHYMLPGVLYLRSNTRKYFFNFIKYQYPHLYDELSVLYKTGGANKEYKDQFYRMLNLMRNKYNLSGGYSKPMKEKMRGEEASFWTMPK